MTLDEIMSPERAQAWRSRIAPARETDLLGPANGE
jgi:hypothetical protein